MANTTGKKFGGREKGTPNKTTQEIRELIQHLIEDNVDKLQEDLDSLEAKDRIKAIVDLAKFVLPTLKSQAISVGEEEPIIISFID